MHPITSVDFAGSLQAQTGAEIRRKIERNNLIISIVRESVLASRTPRVRQNLSLDKHHFLPKGEYGFK